MSSNKFGGLYYCCEECTTATSSKNTSHEDLASTCNEIKLTLENLSLDFNRRLTQIEQQNNQFPKEVKESINSYADAVTKNIKENSENISSKIETDRKTLSEINKDLECVKTTMEKSTENEKEANEIQQKKNNICIFNIPEGKSQNPDECYRHDVEAVKSILSEKVPMKKEEIIAIYRIGEEQPDEDKNRPIIVKFSNQQLKIKVLKLRNLKYTESDEVHNIYISKDRTKKEQKAYKLLRKQLKEKKESTGEDNFIIRNGEIVKRRPFRANPQLLWG